MLATILLVFAFVFFVISAIFSEPGKRYTSVGLSAWSLAEIFMRSGLFGR